MILLYYRNTTNQQASQYLLITRLYVYYSRLLFIRAFPRPLRRDRDQFYIKFNTSAFYTYTLIQPITLLPTINHLTKALGIGINQSIYQSYLLELVILASVTLQLTYLNYLYISLLLETSQCPFFFTCWLIFKLEKVFLPNFFQEKSGRLPAKKP